MTLHVETGGLGWRDHQLELLLALAAFVTDVVEANGGDWTVKHLSDAGEITGTDAEDRQISLQLGADPARCYFHVCSDVANARPRMHMAASTGYTGDPTKWHSHTGGYTDAHWQALSVPNGGENYQPRYWFHADDTYIIVTVEMKGGWFQHAFLGQLTCFEGVSNGYYIDGMVRHSDLANAAADFDGSTGNPLTFTTPLGLRGQTIAGSTYGSGRILDHGGTWRGVGIWGTDPTQAQTSLDHTPTTGVRSPHNFAVFNPGWKTASSNAVPQLSASTLFAKHSTLANTWSPMGVIPGMFHVDTTGIREMQLLTIGEDTYRVFPLCKTRRVAHVNRYAGLAVRSHNE